MRAVRLYRGHFGIAPHLRLTQTQVDFVASLLAILLICGFLAYGSALALRAIDLM